MKLDILTKKATALLKKCSTVTICFSDGHSYTAPRIMVKSDTEGFNEVTVDEQAVPDCQPGGTRAKLCYFDDRDTVILFGKAFCEDGAHGGKLRFVGEEGTFWIDGEFTAVIP